ncbi:MAG: carboxypeptidase-like regulatory domain-containing protein [Prolixibacteraceae bacterium]|nr:carboxypeptidase-like regulatory domain-containing protein [Prolixibacteraceae bacterium]
MKIKPAFGILLIVFLLSVRIACGQKENTSVLDKKISLEVIDEPISAILEKISAQAQVFFSYDATLIEADKKANLSVTDKTIQEALDYLFNSKFVLQALGDQIVITQPEPEEIKKKEIEVVEEKPKVIIFSGRVIDREEKDVLPYTSISILRSSIGTISNSDGDFELKIPESMKQDTVIFSCLGYRQHRQPISEITDQNYTIYLQPTSLQLKEIKVTVINPQEILNKILSKMLLNYPRDPEIMTSFYREVLKQDNKYIDVAEAVMEIRKAPYDNSFAQDKVKFIKGRKNLNVKPFQYVDFKIQGGPYYITKLDAVKTLDSFLDPEFRDFYKYSLEEIVEFDNRETYVIRFKPKEKVDYPCYQGKLYVDMSSLALVQAEFSLSRSGLKFAHESLIRKKPKDFYVRPINVDYKVSYRRAANKWHLSSAQASIQFKVKSKKDKVNSTFHSTSELLITDINPDDGTHYKKNELFSPKDIFTEIITTYDEGFWGNYNTIKPSEDLRKTLRKYYLENDSLFKLNEKEESLFIKK